MADVLVVAVFDDEPTAWDAVVTASTIAAQGQLGLHDACLVVRADDGAVHMRETHDISTSKSGWDGGGGGGPARAGRGGSSAAPSWASRSRSRRPAQVSASSPHAVATSASPTSSSARSPTAS